MAGAGPGGFLGAFGQSKATLYTPDSGTRITFADVAGIEEAKQDLAEVVDFLKMPEKYQRLGAQIPHGILLVGAPGTGKTLLARAVAGESNRPFFSLSASEFVEAIVGVGAARVRDLFAKAKAAAPSIIFIDELDAIGRARASSATFGANDEREQTLNQILTEMDGFTPNQNVVVLAATNRPEVLDPALLRPGRFDRRVTVSAPDKTGREAILKIHTRNVALAPDVDLGDIAGATAGFVGADLRNIVNEAALVAARKGRTAVTREDFDEAIERAVLGLRRPIEPGDGAVAAQHFSEETAKLLDEEVRRIVDECHREAVRLLTENRDRLDRLAEAVLKKDTLDQEEIYSAAGISKPPTAHPAIAPALPANGSSHDGDLAKDEVGSEVTRA